MKNSLMNPLSIQMRSLRRSLFALTTFAALGLALSPVARAASHTWSGAVNGNWSNAGNWSAGGVPTLAETNTLTFPASATRTVITNNIGALKVFSFNFSGSNHIVRGASAFTFEPNLISINCSGGSNTIESPIILLSSHVASVPDGCDLVLNTISGVGGLVKFNGGRLYLRGTGNNTFSGGLTVNSGAVHLEKTGGATAVSSALTLVGSTNFGDFASARLFASEQIAGNVNVFVHPNGILNLNGYTNMLNNLTVVAGAAYNGGLIRLNGNLTLAGINNSFPTPDVSPLINGQLEFIGTAATITVSNIICEIQADIVENGTPTALNKNGPGTLHLKGTANNYTGALIVQQGRVIAENSTAFGTSAGSTTVSNGATLEIRNGMSSAEPLALTGLGDDGQGAVQLFGAGSVATLSGVITLTGDTGLGVVGVGGALSLDGPIVGGGGLRKLGVGTLSLNGFGNNSFSGASFVAKGQLTLNKSANVRAIGSVTVTNGAALVFNANEQMDNAGVLSIYAGGSVNLTNRNETIGGLNLGGNVVVNSGTGTLTLLGNIFAGPPYTTNANTAATMRGQLSLGGATRSVSSDIFSTRVVFDCVMSDGAGATCSFPCCGRTRSAAR